MNLKSYPFTSQVALARLLRISRDPVQDESSPPSIKLGFA